MSLRLLVALPIAMGGCCVCATASHRTPCRGASVRLRRVLFVIRLFMRRRLSQRWRVSATFEVHDDC